MRSIDLLETLQLIDLGVRRLTDLILEDAPQERLAVAAMVVAIAFQDMDHVYDWLSTTDIEIRIQDN